MVDLGPKGPDTDLNDDEVIDASPEEGGGIESAEVESARSAGTIVKHIMVRDFKSKRISPPRGAL